MKLILENVKKSFADREVLKKASFSFEKGKIYGLLGRNGAGKTTLFNCISKEINYNEGNIYLLNGEEKQELSYDKIGYCFSEPVLPEFLTGYEFIKFYIDINKELIKEPLTIEEYFELVDFKKEDMYKLIKDYSQGMKNKLQMMLFIILRPPVILLDEPLTSLDVVVALEIKNLLKKLKSEHIIIFSTHILQLATDLCDEIVVLNQGVLEEVDNNIIHDKDFEEKIMEILKEEE
ncbi:ABC-2 type transport system ATP-binding protein [Clostridium sp. DSM 8431]|uniref:ABC transporter ATP-binding protein n=1 Tax=Clostridium sp. DSM 8431 TaxID=1761781 RepID=UPI0008F444B3|nr:ABC transporter ATP-binding protein [Clostridium sp. DSM 8431]SFU37322.1 ABC-2 type transport system ATP-binding protein [Clostridium sp. DSM 8431]